MQWLIYRVKLWWYEYHKDRRNPNNPGALEQDVQALLNAIHAPCLVDCTRRMGHNINLSVAQRHVHDLFGAFEQAEANVMDGSPILTLVQRARREPHLRTTTLSDYLMTRDDTPITAWEAYRGIRSLYEDLLGYMSTVDAAELSFHRRQFTHMFEEVRVLLLALIEVSLHAKRKTKSGARIDR